MLVLFASVFNLLPVGVVIGMFVDNPPQRLGLTLLVAFGCTYVLVQILRRRFIALFVKSELVINETRRQPDRRTSATVQALTSCGFAIGGAVVVSTTAKDTLTRPIVVMRRQVDGQVAQANSMGVVLMTLLGDDSWLVTSTTPVITHPSLRIERVSTGAITEAVERHDDRRRSLHASGVASSAQPGVLDTILHFEQLEQDTLRSFRARGTAAPSSRSLTSSTSL